MWLAPVHEVARCCAPPGAGQGLGGLLGVRSARRGGRERRDLGVKEVRQVKVEIIRTVESNLGGNVKAVQCSCIHAVELGPCLKVVPSTYLSRATDVGLSSST